MSGAFKPIPEGDDWIVAKFKDLQRQIDAVRTAPNIRNSTISPGGTLTIQEGALVVTDASGDIIARVGLLDGGLHGVEVSDNSGVIQVRLGELAAGGYGLEQVGADGSTVPLDILAYGIKAVSLSSGTFISIADTSGAFVNGSGGPTLSGVIVGPSGRMLITVGALISPDANVEASIGAALSGATTVAATGLHAASYFSVGTTVSAGSVSASWLQTGLNPGSHTLTAKYLVHDISGSGSGDFDNRFIIAQPF